MRHLDLQILCLFWFFLYMFNLQYTSIKPLGDRVLVKIKEAEEKTIGGILLPSTAQTKPQGGEVVAVGEGRTIGKTKVDITVPVIHSPPLFPRLLRFLLINSSEMSFFFLFLFFSWCRLEHRLSTLNMQELRWISMM